MKQEKLVTILMPVYNVEKYIRECIESMLNQTYTNFEFLIYDDASSDDTVKVIEEFRDMRIELIRNEENVGLTKNLNAGLKRARGEYIVRMDGDDVSDCTRIEKQVRFMDENPDIILSGTAFRHIGMEDRIIYYPFDDDMIKAKLVFEPAIIHNAFIIRKSVLQENNLWYNEELRYAQDYNFIFRLMNYGKYANIPEVLVDYRIHEKMTRFSKTMRQRECAAYTRKEIFDALNINLCADELRSWENFCNNEYGNIVKTDIDMIESICEKIVANNKVIRLFEQNALVRVIEEKRASYMDGQRNWDMGYKAFSDKHLQMFLLMNRWVKIKQEGGHLSDWFIKREYSNIAIYGFGYIGETFLRELEGTPINVKYIVDRKINKYSDKAKVITLLDDFERVDIIVVTAISQYEQIKKVLIEKTDSPTISLEDIIKGI